MRAEDVLLLIQSNRLVAANCLELFVESVQASVQANELLWSGRQVTLAAGEFESQGGFDDAIGAKVRYRALKRMRATLHSTGVAHGQGLFDFRHGIGIVVKKELRHFFQQLLVAAHTVERQG